MELCVKNTYEIYKPEKGKYRREKIKNYRNVRRKIKNTETNALKINADRIVDIDTFEFNENLEELTINTNFHALNMRLLRLPESLKKLTIENSKIKNSKKLFHNNLNLEIQLLNCTKFPRKCITENDIVIISKDDDKKYDYKESYKNFYDTVDTVHTVKILKIRHRYPKTYFREMKHDYTKDFSLRI